MAAPTITSVSPANLASDVVLGSQIVVTFDQVVDHTTVNEGTFSVEGPGQTLTLTPEHLASSDPQPVTGREYITGTFVFDDTSGHTIVTFNPKRPFQPNGIYVILVLGGDGNLSSDSVKNAGAESMAQSFRWTFTTGDLNVTTPPATAPLPALLPRINPKDIVVVPRPPIGNDLSGSIDIIFPGPIDTNSFNLSDILVSIEPILGDPSVTIPPGLISAIQFVGNTTIRLTITGWPT
jgi:hypothetical protein